MPIEPRLLSGVTFALVLVLAAGACGPQDGPQSARFILGFENSKRTFVVEIEDPKQIAEARATIANPNRRRIVSGTVVKEPAAYNPGWSFHVLPSSVTVAPSSIEVCDSTPEAIEEHLNEVGGSFLPGSRWCPWRGYLQREVSLGDSRP